MTPRQDVPGEPRAERQRRSHLSRIAPIAPGGNGGSDCRRNRARTAARYRPEAPSIVALIAAALAVAISLAISLSISSPLSLAEEVRAWVAEKLPRRSVAPCTAHRSQVASR